MEEAIYKKHIEQEDHHWWFRARRAVCHELLKRLQFPANAAILEAGCGSGGNFPMLSQLGKVYAFEMNDMARAHACARNMATVEYGVLPDHVPFADRQFDLIVMFDVLEHINNDGEALKALSKRLIPSGVLFIAVPAYTFLTSMHDTLHHHRRRYNRSKLIHLIETAGFSVELTTYWNCALLPIACIVRLGNKLGILKNATPGAEIPPPLINNFLASFIALERFINRFIRLPFGLSLIVIARKN